MSERSSLTNYFLASIALVLTMVISIPLLSSTAMAQETKVNAKEETEPLTRIFEPRDFVGSSKVPQSLDTKGFLQPPPLVAAVVTPRWSAGLPDCQSGVSMVKRTRWSR